MTQPVQISDYESEKISAARSGFAPRLNEAKRLIEQYTAAKAEYDQKVEESSEIIESVRTHRGRLFWKDK